MKIKLSVCADYHLNRMYPERIEGLNEIINRAKKNNVDAMIHCGDFITDLENYKHVLDMFLHNDAEIPAFGCYGNHELELTESLEALNAVYGIENSYYYIDLKGFRFVITDTNYFEKDGIIQHYPGYSVGGPDWSYDHNMLGDEQLCWLEEALISSPYPCIIISHASFECEDGCSRDAAKVRKIIRDVNEKYPKRVILCINGHYHTDSVHVVENVVYFNVNTVYNGAWKREKHNFFPKEFLEKYNFASNLEQSAFFKDALNAIVTVDSDGIIDIEGMKTSYLYDVTPEKMGIPTRFHFADLVPYISNAHIELK